MTTLAAVELAVVGLLAFLLYRAGRDARNALLDQDAAHAAERAELLTRIQHPQVIHRRGPRPSENDDSSEPDAKAMRLVGTVAPPKPDGDGD